MVHERLADYIKGFGIKQAEICRKTGISASRMSSILSGELRLTADEYESICKAIQKTPNDFMDYEETKQEA